MLCVLRANQKWYHKQSNTHLAIVHCMKWPKKLCQLETSRSMQKHLHGITKEAWLIGFAHPRFDIPGMTTHAGQLTSTVVGTSCPPQPGHCECLRFHLMTPISHQFYCFSLLLRSKPALVSTIKYGSRHKIRLLTDAYSTLASVLIKGPCCSQLTLFLVPENTFQSVIFP